MGVPLAAGDLAEETQVLLVLYHMEAAAAVVTDQEMEDKQLELVVEVLEDNTLQILRWLVEQFMVIRVMMVDLV